MKFKNNNNDNSYKSVIMALKKYDIYRTKIYKQ